MGAFLIYQFKVAVLITVMFAFYKLLLCNQTFYRFNRSILLTMAILSFVLPFCKITQYMDRFDSFIPTHSIITEVITANTPNDALIIENTDTQTQAISESIIPDNQKNIWLSILLIVYCAVFAFVLIKKLVSILSIAIVIKKGRYANRLDGCDVIESDCIHQPLNWMKFIVMPKEWLEKNNSAVWQHENLHARKWHSVDLFLSDLMTAFQWFNPVMVLFHKELELIHEFEADSAVIESGADTHEYKLMLVNAVASSRGFGMASWLKQSNLKNRIDMMNKTKSNGWNKLRALFIPLLAGIFLLVNSGIAYAKTKTISNSEIKDSTLLDYETGMARLNPIQVSEPKPLVTIPENVMVKEMPKGDFKSCTAVIVEEKSIVYLALKGISFDGKGSMTVNGDKLGLLLGDGTHSVSLGEKFGNTQNKFVIKSDGKELELLISEILYPSTAGRLENFGYMLIKMDGDNLEYKIVIENN